MKKLTLCLLILLGKLSVNALFQMRKIVLIIGLSVCFILSWAYKNPSYNSDNSDMAILYRILPDSIHSMLHNKPILFYSYGHYGYSWSIATKTEDNIRVFSGRVSYSGDCYLENPMGRNRFDSTAFFRLINHSYHGELTPSPLKDQQ